MARLECGAARFGDGICASVGAKRLGFAVRRGWERDGALRWHKSGRGAENARAFSLIVDGSEVIVSGMLAGALAIGGIDLHAATHGDGYLLYAELGSAGRVLRAEAIGSPGEDRAQPDHRARRQRGPRRLLLPPARARWRCHALARKL